MSFATRTFTPTMKSRQRQTATGVAFCAWRAPCCSCSWMSSVSAENVRAADGAGVGRESRGWCCCQRRACAARVRAIKRVWLFPGVGLMWEERVESRGRGCCCKEGVIRIARYHRAIDRSAWPEKRESKGRGNVVVAAAETVDPGGDWRHGGPAGERVVCFQAGL